MKTYALVLTACIGFIGGEAAAQNAATPPVGRNAIRPANFKSAQRPTAVSARPITSLRMIGRQRQLGKPLSPSNPKTIRRQIGRQYHSGIATPPINPKVPRRLIDQQNENPAGTFSYATSPINPKTPQRQRTRPSPIVNGYQLNAGQNFIQPNATKQSSSRRKQIAGIQTDSNNSNSRQLLLSSELVKIDRLRDKAIETEDLDLLKHADSLEKKIREKLRIR
jgi:hypothetical protein